MSVKDLFLSIPPTAAAWAQPPDGHEPPAFVITRAFVEDLRAQKTFLPTYNIRMAARSSVKSLADDCEVHLAGFLQETFAFAELGGTETVP